MNKSRDNKYVLKYSDLILIAADEPIQKALEAVLSLFGLTNVCKPSQKIGITVANSIDAKYRNNLIKLLDEQCHNVLVIWLDSDDEWNKSDWNSLAGEVIQKASGIGDLINALSNPLNSSEWRRARLLQRLQAKAIYDLLEVFGHNSERDITNKFLAPARILLCAKDIPEADKFWNLETTQYLIKMFNRDVCGHINYIHGHLGSMIREYTNAFCNYFNSITEENRDVTIKHLELLMALLTECRMQAGKEIKRYKPGAEEDRSSDDSIRTILVIDDDIMTWKPVLDKLEKELGGHVTIFASPDASEFWPLTALREGRGSDVIRRLPDFDLILLDIYLKDKGGNDLNGLELLRKIRARIMYLPVILWTTSTDKELPSQAALANGFIFKKTATIENIASIVRTWLAVGKSQRLWSLPNPFFDYSLRDPALREVALAFTKWTFRYMDCFHAVDHFYFKYFNDHGGRHILGVLDATAKLLRTFLFEEGDTALFSKHVNIRNKQLFCLYIAILCHEFGMFPIYKGEHPPESQTTPDETNWKRMEHVRKLHGVRGMLMLLEEPATVAEHFDVNGCQTFLDNLDSDKVVGKGGRCVVALLVGYHQRCLDLKNSHESFYKDTGAFADVNREAKGKVDSAKSTGSGNWTNWDTVSECSTIAWQKASEQKSIWSIERIRKLCAILRFADALDVDHTRVPADFLLNSNDRRSLQDVEDCKRQVLAAVEIDNDRVSFKFYATEPNENWINDCCTFSITAFKTLKDDTTINDEKAKEDFISLLNDEAKCCKDGPVFEDLLEPTQLSKIKKNLFGLFSDCWRYSTDLKNIEKYLKGCLQVYFTSLKFRGNCLIEHKVKKTIATAAAMLVILEIKNEYKAIEDVGLAEDIKPDSVEWLKGPLPSIL